MTETFDSILDLGPNAWLLDEMKERWEADPGSVDAQWRAIFDAVFLCRRFACES